MSFFDLLEGTNPKRLKNLLSLLNKHGVSHLKMEDVEITFFQDGRQATGVRQTSEQPLTPGETEVKALETLDPNLALELIQNQKMMDDPLAYEQDQIDGR